MNNSARYSEQELMARLKFFIGICLAVTLIGIVFVVLYSIIFVTQPLNAMSPIDAKFFELIIPVATFLCGTLSGIMLAGSGQDAARAGAEMMDKMNTVRSGTAASVPQISANIPKPMSSPSMMPTSAPPVAAKVPVSSAPSPSANLIKPPEETPPEI
jgi:hypothetical protein